MAEEEGYGGKIGWLYLTVFIDLFFRLVGQYES